MFCQLLLYFCFLWSLWQRKDEVQNNGAHGIKPIILFTIVARQTFWWSNVLVTEMDMCVMCELIIWCCDGSQYFYGHVNAGSLSTQKSIRPSISKYKAYIDSLRQGFYQNITLLVRGLCGIKLVSLDLYTKSFDCDFVYIDHINWVTFDQNLVLTIQNMVDMLGQRKYDLGLTSFLRSLRGLLVDMLSMWKVEFCVRSIYCGHYNLFFVQENAVVEAAISWSVTQYCSIHVFIATWDAFVHSIGIGKYYPAHIVALAIPTNYHFLCHTLKVCNAPFVIH